MEVAFDGEKRRGAIDLAKGERVVRFADTDEGCAKTISDFEFPLRLCRGRDAEGPRSGAAPG
ncbi:hypothetical protein D3C87_1822120 [compost metagenome]